MCVSVCVCARECVRACVCICVKRLIDFVYMCDVDSSLPPPPPPPPPHYLSIEHPGGATDMKNGNLVNLEIHLVKFVT